MKGSDVVLLILTFVLGIFAGFYFYVQFFIPEVRDSAGAEVPTNVPWTMNVMEVGACGATDTCARFQVNNDGAYSYQASAQAEIETGTLARSERRDANELALGTDWYNTERNQQCSQTATYWYQFDVMTDTERFQVGLCSELFDDSSTYKIIEHFLPRVISAADGAGSSDGDSEGTTGWWFNRESTFRSPVQFWVYGLNYPGNQENNEE